MTERIEAVFSGRVQGVGFRWSVVEMARGQGSLTGWVRNEPDGSVRLVAEGEAPALSALVESVFARWRTHITSHRVERSPAKGDISGFTVAR